MGRQSWLIILLGAVACLAVSGRDDPPPASNDFGDAAIADALKDAQAGTPKDAQVDTPKDAHAVTSKDAHANAPKDVTNVDHQKPADDRGLMNLASKVSSSRSVSGLL